MAESPTQTKAIFFSSNMPTCCTDKNDLSTSHDAQETGEALLRRESTTGEDNTQRFEVVPSSEKINCVLIMHPHDYTFPALNEASTCFLMDELVEPFLQTEDGLTKNTSPARHEVSRPIGLANYSVVENPELHVEKQKIFRREVVSPCVIGAVSSNVIGGAVTREMDFAGCRNGAVLMEDENDDQKSSTGNVNLTSESRRQQVLAVHRRRHNHRRRQSQNVDTPELVSRRRKRRISPTWSAALRHAVPLLKPEKVVNLLIAACERSEGTLESVKAQLSQEPSCRRVLVRNIPYLLPAAELFTALETSLGEVERVFVSSKGSGIAIFGKFETACKAVCSDETVVSIKGRTLQFKFTNDVINEGDAWPLVTKTPANKRRNELLVRDLAPSITESGLAAAFAHFGDIKRVYLPVDNQGQHKGHAYVTFADPDDALRAAQQSQRLINERMAFVTLAAGKQRRSSTRNNK